MSGPYRWKETQMAKHAQVTGPVIGPSGFPQVEWCLRDDCRQERARFLQEQLAFIDALDAAHATVAELRQELWVGRDEFEEYRENHPCKSCDPDDLMAPSPCSGPTGVDPAQLTLADGDYEVS
jgi:hypothetical protein